MLAEPGGEIGLMEFPTGEKENQNDDFFLCCFNAEAVQPEEEIHGLECDALVSVNERMVMGEAESIGCGEGGEIRVRVVGEPVSRTFEGRLQETPIPESKGPTVLGTSVFVLVQRASHGGGGFGEGNGTASNKEAAGCGRLRPPPTQPSTSEARNRNR